MAKYKVQLFVSYYETVVVEADTWEEAEPLAVYEVNTDRHLTGSVDSVNSYQRDSEDKVYPND